MKLLKSFLVILIIGFTIVLTYSFFSEEDKTQKIKGVSFVASRDTISNKHIIPVKTINANWSSIMPFGIMRAKDNPELFYNTERHWYGERYDGSKHSIDLMHQNGIKVMLKPQIWIVNGEFTGELNMLSEDEWKSFERNYEDMLLLYARLAQETNAELFCIGTELNSFVIKRPEFWNNLIVKVKAIYNGKLTYAENWDRVSEVPFWEDLDYIGVDAYFPVSDAKTPQVEDVKKSWVTINAKLEHLSKTNNKPILFTEFGYRSIDFAGKTPWDATTVEGQVNEDAQHNLIQGLLESVWDKAWFSGGFLWKWFHNPESISDRHKNRFSVHGKKAEELLKDWYGM